MSFIIENWAIVFVAIAAIVATTIVTIRFMQSSTDEQIKKVREWLLYATSLAEKELGSGTGVLKLRYVYDMFVIKFPWLARVISFEVFSNIVDDVLAELNDLLATNSAVQTYVTGNE